MKHSALLNLSLPLYEMKEVEKMMSACKSFDCSGEELLRKALTEFYKNHNIVD